MKIVVCLISIIVSIILSNSIFLLLNEKHCTKKRKNLILAFLGIMLFMFFMSMNLVIDKINLDRILYTIFGVIYLLVISIIGMKSILKKEFDREILFYGILVDILYALVLWIVEGTSILFYVIFFLMILLSLFVDTILMAKKKNYSHIILIFILCIYMAMFTTPEVFIVTAIMTFLTAAIYLIMNKIKNKKVKYEGKQIKSQKQISMEFILCISNIIILIINQFVQNYL